MTRGPQSGAPRPDWRSGSSVISGARRILRLSANNHGPLGHDPDDDARGHGGCTSLWPSSAGTRTSSRGHPDAAGT